MEIFRYLLIDLAVAVCCRIRPGGARSLVAENIVLRQQLIVLGRSRKRSPHLTPCDRVIFGLCALLIRPRRVSKIAVVLRPSTILRIHRALVKRKYSQLFAPKTRRVSGPKGPPPEIVDLVVELKRRNPTFGCPRIAFIVNNTLGVDIDKDVVRRILARHKAPPFTGNDGPSWLTFFADAKDSAWSVDLFRCESIHLKSHWVLVVIDIYPRRIIGFAVQAGSVDGPAVCAMFAKAISGHPAPRFLSTDNDPLFRYHRWQANLRILDIEEIKSVPFMPQSHPFVERLIGTIRREYLDQTLFWTSTDLDRKLTSFADYYSQHRAHTSLGGCAPIDFPDQEKFLSTNKSQIQWDSHLNGRYQLPMAA